MTAKSPREDEVRTARERLIAEGLLRAAVPSALVAKEIEQSWRRSASSRIDPGAGPRIIGEIDPDSAILRAAGRILDQWQTNLADSRLTLFLADEAGRIVSRRIIDAQDEQAMDQAYAVEGFDFSEQSLGTNGLGTPIEARGVVFVRGAEHFNDALAQLACAGAPIKHPITGRIVGSLALTSHVDHASTLMVAMARQASQEIAEALENMADSRDLDLARTYRRFRSSRHPVLVMNSGTVMTDLPALAHVDAEFYAVLWEKLRVHRWDQSELRFDLPMLGTDVMVRRFGRPGQDAIFALEFLQPAGTADSGDVAIVRNPEGADVSHRRGVLDGTASRQTRPSPYGDVQRQLTASAAVDGLIRVVGGPGSGKRYQASKWLRQRTGQEPKVFAARDLPTDDGVWGDGEAALRDGHGIIVVGGEKLSSELLDRLDDFARLPRPGVQPGARVILTERAGTSSPEYGVDVPMAVRVPSLADLRGELCDVVRELAAELYPGVPTPRFSPAALQCLLAWPWSGNVAELIRVLAAVLDVAHGGLLETKDLPAAMRQTPRFSLSRYEQGERDSIVSALREAGGNKARAADILGIGRTTLYRKMRTLKIDADERMTAPGR